MVGRFREILLYFGVVLPNMRPVSSVLTIYRANASRRLKVCMELGYVNNMYVIYIGVPISNM